MKILLMTITFGLQIIIICGIIIYSICQVTEDEENLPNNAKIIKKSRKI